MDSAHIFTHLLHYAAFVCAFCSSLGRAAPQSPEYNIDNRKLGPELFSAEEVVYQSHPITFKSSSIPTNPACFVCACVDMYVLSVNSYPFVCSYCVAHHNDP